MRAARARCYTVEAIEETHEAIALTIRQFVGALQDLTGTSMDIPEYERVRRAATFHRWAVS